jgi:hypothetical protein
MIFKDISRTLPTHDYFKELNGKGQRALFFVLKALASEIKDASYV